MIPEKIGRYEIKAELGRGGMATVYRGFDPRFMREIAVKVLPREFLHDPNFRARFEREARTIAALEHPAIVPVYDFGEEEGQPYIVMRLMSGGSLADRLVHGPLPLAESARIFGHLAPALDRAHSKGIVHRDLKPGNILFDEDGLPYISDFGIAKLTQSSAAFTGTAIVGTPAYMSPEQARGDKTIDGRSDIYALGAIVYQMLTGKLPFDADTPMGVALKHITEPVPSILESRPDLPPACDTLIHTAMAKTREERFATAGRMAESFASAASGKPSPVTAPVPAVAPRTTLVSTPPPQSGRPAKEAPAVKPATAERRVVPTVADAAAHRPTRQLPASEPRQAKKRGASLGLILGGVGLMLVCAAAGVGGFVALGPSVQNFFRTQLGPAQPASEVTNTAPPSSPTAQAAHSDLSTPTPAAARCPEPVDASAVETPANPITLAGGVSYEPEKIVPYYGFANEIAPLALAGLAEWDTEGNMMPELAESWTLSNDGLTVTFKLRNCLYWSDGEPITSADVKFTIESIKNTANAVNDRSGYDRIGSVAAPDERTVVIRFLEVYPAWQTLFTHGVYSPAAILPEHILKGKTGLENNEFIRKPTVASGPFVIREWVAGDHMTLIANPNYYKGRPTIDQIVIRFNLDSSTALAALQAGELDWYADFFVTDINSIYAAGPQVSLITAPDVYVEHYFFNLGTTRGVLGQGKSDANGFCPFQDVRVRKAIILGIDRERIINALLDGRTFVPTSLWSGSPYWANSDLQPETYDPEQARQLLAEAGYAPASDGILAGTCGGQRTRLSFDFYTTTSQIRVDIANLVRDHLRQIGVDFNPVHLSGGPFFSGYADGGVLYTGSYDMASYAIGYLPEPYTGDFSCSQVPSRDYPDGYNAYHYCDPQLDELFARLNTTADPDARKALLDRIQVYIHENALIIPIYQRLVVVGVSNRFAPPAFSGLTGFTWNAEEWDVR